MQYPRGFPQEAIAHVERAGLEGRKHLKERGADHAKFRKYVLRVFLAFAQAACKLGITRKWGVEKIRSDAYYFLNNFWSEAYEEFRNRLAIRQPCYRPSWSDLEWEFGRSEEWRQFEEELLAVAKAQSDPPVDPPENLKADVQTCGERRRAAVGAYIAEVLQTTGKRIFFKDIWEKAGYKTRTEFERWKRCDPKHPNQAADKAITRVLREKPHLK